MTFQLNWFIVLLFYIVNLSLFFVLSKKTKISSLELINIIFNYNIFGKSTIILFFFNLIGVPVTPGFFLKFFLFTNILYTTHSITITLLFIFLNFIFFYFYLRALKFNSQVFSKKLPALTPQTNFYIILYLYFNIFFFISWFIFLIF